MANATKKKCECPVCTYGRKIRDLIHRTPNAVDKALIEELYDNLIHAEDDRDYHSIKNEGCAIQHGGIGFTDACTAIEVHRLVKCTCAETKLKGGELAKCPWCVARAAE